MTSFLNLVCCCDCENTIFAIFSKNGEIDESEVPLLEERKQVHYKEPLLVARIARENSTGGWDHLQSLRTSPHWSSRLRKSGHSNPDFQRSPPVVQSIENSLTFPSAFPSERPRRLDDIELTDEDIEADQESNCDESDDEVSQVIKITRKKNSAAGKTVNLKTHSTASVTAITESSDASTPQSKTKYKGKSFADLFKLGEQIGYGSTATVFKCHRRRELSFSRAPLAVKVIDKKKLTGLENRSRKQTNLLQQFRQEIEILDSLRHRHIIRIYGMFETSKNLHVVTELCEGGELFDFLTQQPNAHLAGEKELVAKKIVFQVASAVEYMHSQGIIHRDIKLENILLLKKINPNQCIQQVDNIDCKIIDFGLAKSSMKGATLNERLQGRAKTFFGTVGYLAPEMFNNKSYNNRVDVWAVGVLTYVLLCGSFPFDDSATSRKRPVHKSTLKRRYKIKYPSRVRKLISDDAKLFLSRLLDPDARARLSSQEVTSLSWLCSDKEQLFS